MKNTIKVYHSLIKNILIHSFSIFFTKKVYTVYLKSLRLNPLFLKKKKKPINFILMAIKTFN